MVKEIELINGMVTLVDDEDYEKLSKYDWGYQKKGGYAKRSIRRNGKVTTFMMHRVIMGVVGRWKFVDHINQDGLDNRRCNLRLADNKRNCANRGKRRDNKSGYKGVFENDRGKFIASCACKVIGSFNTAEEAARAYDQRAKEEYGEFARLNFPKSPSKQD